MKRLKKLIRNPNIFFRDYLNKKYPYKNIEQPFFEYEENLIIDHESLLNKIEMKNNSQDSFPIDVVFTWVNNKDPVWQKKLENYLSRDSASYSPLAIDNARFENRDELFFSVHSVLKYIPWINHIYLVTDNQIPDWLYPNEKITIIDHKDIIDGKYLPTFNSHVIEAHLHKIPGLSENFIYFNDDVFVARKLEREHFFHHNQIASIFLTDKSLISMKEKGRITPTLLASENSLSLLKKRYPSNIDTPLVHTYFPLKKSIYKLCWQFFENEIEDFLSNKFRGNNDLNLATFLVPWLMYLEGESIPKVEICYYFNIRSNQAKIFYQKLLYKKEIGYPPHSFCANDLCNKNDDISSLELDNFLNEYFNDKFFWRKINE
ncbi:stealth family protein [Mannheimia haemolytica]|uniref:stealth family protein n=1 Tax=Mannheimia haemolytica TaxID=75985 RepID=UPI0039FDAF4F